VRIIAVDRANGRVVHLSLDGELLGVVATDMLLPAAVAIQGDYAAIGELKGQVTILDKSGRSSPNSARTATPPKPAATIRPDQMDRGNVTSPHGVAFTANGDVLVSEYNKFGRVHLFKRQ